MTYNKTSWMVALLAGALFMAGCPDDNNNNGTPEPADMTTTQTDMPEETDMPDVEEDQAPDMPDVEEDMQPDMPDPEEDMEPDMDDPEDMPDDMPGDMPSGDPDPTCENYCTTVMANCTGDDAQYESNEACLAYCQNVGGWEDGTKGDTDGDTIACRIYHGGVAEGDPATHCDHAGPSGGNVCGSWCDVYCALSRNNCDGDDSLYNNDAECETACAGFDTDGEAGDLEYDTVQCRIYHLGAPAATDPALHCSHGGEEPDAFCVGKPEDFIFATDTPDAYTRHDRIGMPAVSTALIASKEGYNDQDPIDDIDPNNPFVAEIVATLDFLHTALDSQLVGLGLVPCTVLGGTGTCVTQGAPLVLPDDISIDTTQPAGFPNGRRLNDPVIDITLAVILLDLSVAGQDATSLVGVNPTQNDLGVEGAFLPAFPYLHPPHTP